MTISAEAGPGADSSLRKRDALRRLLRPGSLVVSLDGGTDRWIRSCPARGKDLTVRSSRVLPSSAEQAAAEIDRILGDGAAAIIGLLRIGAAEAIEPVLEGAARWLESGRIASIWFRHDGEGRPPRERLVRSLVALASRRYEIFIVRRRHLCRLIGHPESPDSLRGCELLAVHERMVSTLLGGSEEMLDVARLCRWYRIPARGVIHVGAHEGEELGLYGSMGFDRALLVEANPEVYERLVVSAARAGAIQVRTAQRAIAARESTAVLHIASADQSSSILPLARHTEIYPGIREVGTLPVRTTPLDDLLAEMELPAADYNMLNIDVQGGELGVLEGAARTLEHVEAVNLEINYEELYAGCPMIEEIDAFLGERGFRRVATATPYHPSWGDAFYVRRDVVSMSTLGANGRFGNQIFQYAFLEIQAREQGLIAQTPSWTGTRLFGCDDPPVASRLPESKEPAMGERVANTDLWGYFQLPTKHYAPHRQEFRDLFRPAPEVRRRAEAALSRLRGKGSQVVGLHMRIGDYGKGFFFIAPPAWYEAWLEEIWPQLDRPVLFVASDAAELVRSFFPRYSPVTWADLGEEDLRPGYYGDHYILSQCDALAIANSSFSFTAAMLNERAGRFARPDLSARRLVEFDPWDSSPLLTGEKIEDHPDLLVAGLALKRRARRSGRGIGGFLRRLGRGGKAR